VSRNESVTNKEFSHYQEFIVKHNNYQSLPSKINSSGEITWVKVKDAARTRWWDELKEKLKVRDRASVARAIHPPELGGYKPCQVCGRKMSIHYVYPDLRTTQKLIETFPDIEVVHFGIEISEIAKRVQTKYKYNGLKELASIFNQELDFKSAEDLVARISFLQKQLSPGVMSNAPDRLDGFHTYNACCRHTQDSGRHRSNLSRYTSDRRAYENWADGNWRGADRLMGKYKASQQKVICNSCGNRAKMTADHIGPISLGFTHRMDFRPICIKCNSKKNNRMSFNDVTNLLAAENVGEVVVSWHSRALWNKLKVKIINDQSALKASKLLRKNMHYVMCILSEIKSAGYDKFLNEFLHPEYALLDYEFTYFDVTTGEFEASEVRVDSLNTRKLAKRYIRISFQSLEEYNKKNNRKALKWKDKSADKILVCVLELLEKSQTKKAKKKLLELLDHLAVELTATF
jgi:Alw26I/Eco31I/Esp3I family type II restriction endonuclease